MCHRLFFCSLLLFSYVAATFDCRRPNQNCQNGAVCPFNSRYCQCVPANVYEGYDCGLLTSTKGVGDCPNSDPCVPNHGECYDDDGVINDVAKCYCNQNYYGDVCEEERFTVSCSSYFMVVGINPNGNFTGVAFIKGKKETTACGAKPVESAIPLDNVPSEWSGYFIKVSHDSTDCSPAETAILSEDKEYSRTIVVQYNTDFITNVDDSFIVKCRVTLNGTVVSSRTARVNPDLGSLNSVTRSGTTSPVLFGVLTTTGTLGDDLISIGDELLFFFNIPAEYASLVILDGEADNNVQVGTKTLKLIEDRCIHSNAFVVTKQPPLRGNSGNDKREITLILKAFHFAGNYEVVFRFTVKVCMVDNDADCNPVDCQYAKPSSRRKKRSSQDETVLTKVVKIRNPDLIIEEREREECPVSMKIMSAVIALGITLFFCVSVCVILTVRLISVQRPTTHCKEHFHSTSYATQQIERNLGPTDVTSKCNLFN